MEIVLNNKGKLNVDQKGQERVRMMDDKNLEKEYLALKEQLSAFRRQTLMQQFLEKKSNHMPSPINPEVQSDKHRKMQINKVIAMNILPNKKERSHSSSKKLENLPPHPPADKNCQHYQTILIQHLDHMTKRA